ncbi:hypothetical protein EYF80_059174 [Liparis tanakae]|uniref:Uncharacterized protein n=1 Tax=Liparis tanakae TaxID=230148 RepID=A0A4Z2EPG1_9TELE|nr:hypothetical protein EYF80_059174 [Liparis tanakae]
MLQLDRQLCYTWCSKWYELATSSEREMSRFQTAAPLGSGGTPRPPGGNRVSAAVLPRPTALLLSLTPTAAPRCSRASPLASHTPVIPHRGGGGKQGPFRGSRGAERGGEGQRGAERGREGQRGF